MTVDDLRILGDRLRHGPVPTQAKKVYACRGHIQDLLEIIPGSVAIRGSVLDDRVHAYLPGWEIPIIAPSNYARGYGFISDYAAEIFRLLRRRNYQTHLVARTKFPTGMSQRAHDAVKKTAAGLLKLVYPHRTPDDVESGELKFCLDLAVEMRQRVVEQLQAIAPKEFQKITLGFERR